MLSDDFVNMYKAKRIEVMPVAREIAIQNEDFENREKFFVERLQTVLEKKATAMKSTAQVVYQVWAVLLNVWTQL